MQCTSIRVYTEQFYLREYTYSTLYMCSTMYRSVQRFSKMGAKKLFSKVGTKQLFSNVGNKQLFSKVGTKQLFSKVGTKQLFSKVGRTFFSEVGMKQLCSKVDTKIYIFSNAGIKLLFQKWVIKSYFLLLIFYLSMQITIVTHCNDSIVP